MNLRNATIAYLLVLASLTTIPASIVLTAHGSHAMVPFTSYQDLQEFIHGAGCPSPASLSNAGGRAPGSTTASYTSQSNSGSSQTPSHSETNQQVSGVDELDTVKNDGQYIYTITNNSVAIVQAYPTTDATLVSRFSVNGTLQGMFVVGNRLVVVSQIYGYSSIGEGSRVTTVASGVQTNSIATIWPISSSGTTSLFVVDISDHSNPIITTRVEVNGTMDGARLIGNDVYLVATQSVYCYGRILLPEQVVNGRVVTFTPSQVYHSDIIDQGYSFTTVIGLDTTLNNPNPTAKIYLIGSTSTIYVSLHDIYLTQPAWAQNGQTIIHRISIDGLAINYQATGTVPGHILNQFSMDEDNGYFRVATTSCCTESRGQQPLWTITTSQQVTNVYVLDKSLNTVGKLEDLSPGEQIYSARFMGDKAYLVTYKRTDPLLVIGLDDPTKPTVLGQLTITGVSDYLQPYDETHLMGIGQSGADVAWEDAIRFTGLKVSLFNVADPNDPIETSRYIVGGPGTSSPAISDHRAVLFDKSHNLLVIPIEITAQQTNNTVWYPYQPIWQGAYVFNVTPDNGIVFRGGITQLTSGQLSQLLTWSSYTHFITRTLYIGNVLYTVSNAVIQMNSLSDLSEIASVNL
jgi:inhibitor of cysteine peptidase